MKPAFEFVAGMFALSLVLGCILFGFLVVAGDAPEPADFNPAIAEIVSTTTPDGALK